MQKIGVFLSARTELPPAYREAAQAVGRWVGETGRTLIFGGADKGMMEVLAQSAKQAGATVWGVVPQILERQGWVSDTLDVTFHCADLNDRKAILNRESDILVALPGGIGTLDEVFTVLGAATIGLERKHVVLYNVSGCWDGLLALLEEMQRNGLVGDDWRQLLTVVDNLDDLETACR